MPAGPLKANRDKRLGPRLLDSAAVIFDLRGRDAARLTQLLIGRHQTRLRENPGIEHNL